MRVPVTFTRKKRSGPSKLTRAVMAISGCSWWRCPGLWGHTRFSHRGSKSTHSALGDGLGSSLFTSGGALATAAALKAAPPVGFGTNPRWASARSWLSPIHPLTRPRTSRSR